MTFYRPASRAAVAAMGKSGSSTHNREESGVVDSESDPAWDRFQASYDNDGSFSATWDGRRPDLSDQSPSGYDMALAQRGCEVRVA